MSGIGRHGGRPRYLMCAAAVLPWLVAALPSHAAPDSGLALVLLVPERSAGATGPLGVWLVTLNGSARAATYTFPAQVEFVLRAGGADHPQSGTPADGRGAVPTVIQPGGHARREYRVPLPEGLAGAVVLRGRSLAANAVVLEIPRAAAVAAPEAAPLAPDVLAGEPASARFFREHFSGHEPFYFIAGSEYPNARFQLSFKYKLFSDNGDLARAFPPVRGLHLAYTQTSLWDLESTSKPFVDTSYKPHLLYEWRGLDGGRWGNWLRLDLQTGLLHESNGKSGPDSRSLNLAYVEPTLWIGDPDGFRVSLAPKAWTYLGSLDENPRLKDYRGYIGLRATLGWDQYLLLSATGRLGDDGNRGSVQVDLSYPLMQFLDKNLSLYLYSQYFTGYGESLLRYDERSWALRFGFAIYR